MHEIQEALGALAKDVGGLRAAAVVETSGIEVGTWGDADFDLIGVEATELWKSAAASDAQGMGAGGPPESFELRTRGESWLVLPLGADYLLVLGMGADVPPGKARFLARQWVYERREDFA